MQSHTPHGRILAMVAGTAFTAGSLVILMGDAILHPAAWTQYHWLTILTVSGTIAAGHLMATARMARHFLAALGFGVLFLAGTLLVVHNSVGRQALVSESVSLSVETKNQTIAAKHQELMRARQRLDDAERMVNVETGKRGCGRNCQDWKERAKEVRSHVTALEGELKTLGAPEPVAPKAANMAAVLALFGADQVKATAILMLLEPFLYTLFFELGAIVSLGFAFRRVPVAVNDNSVPSWGDTAQTSFPVPDPLPPVSALPEAVPGAEVICWVRKFRERHGRDPRRAEMKAAFPSLSNTTAHRYKHAA
jgi:hypothetical protein